MQELFNQYYAVLPHDLEETALRAERFLGKDKKVLQEAVKNGELETVQLWFEDNFCKKTLRANAQEILFDENRAFKNIIVRDVFEEEFTANFEEEERKVVMDIITEVSLSRRISLEEMFGKFKDRLTMSPSDFESILRRMIEAGFVQYKDEISTFIVQPFFMLSSHAQSMLDCLQANIPMVCAPRKVHKPKDPLKKVRNGYLREYRSVFTRNTDDTEEHQDVAYDFLNIQNANRYQINWEYYDSYGKNHIAFPENEGHSDYEYGKILDASYRQHLKRHFLLSLYRILGIEYIYFLNVFDRRHRNYPVSYFLNPQGTDSDKAVLLFPKQELTSEGLVAFKISIANDYNIKVDGKDLDKKVFKERLAYVEDNLVPLLKLEPAEYKAKVEELAEKADSPHCFVAKMLDFYNQAMDARCGITPSTGIIAHYDATCSGYQLMSIFGHDADLAEMTNVIMPKEEARLDMYTLLAERCYARGLTSKYERNFLKKKVWIPKGYGSINCIIENFKPDEAEIVESVIHEVKGVVYVRSLMEDWDSTQLEYSFWLPDGVKVYKEVKETQDFAGMFMGTKIIVHKTVKAPKAFSCEYAPNAIHAADGFVAREIARAHHYKKEWKEWIYNLYSDPAKWMYCEDEHGSRALMEKLLHLAEVHQFYSLRILYEANEYNIDLIPHNVFMYLYYSLAPESCQVSEIHDSFGVHPNYVGSLMSQYRRILRDLAKSRYIPAVRDYLRHNPEGFTKSKPVSKEFLNGIMNSKYALC